MMSRLFFLSIFLIFLPHDYLLSQTPLPDGRILLKAKIIGNDTIGIIDLKPVEITSKLSPEALKKIQKYNKLRHNVLKVYPYAKLASAKLKEIEENTLNLKTERQKRAYIKEQERLLKQEYSEQLKQLTISQGRILIKLIDRETGNTSYALIKELRGNLQAFFWQSLARLFGEDLKAEYDSVGEDQAIESIIRSIEKGERNE